ncbi:MAG: 6-bladed beta-propeller, partial [Bacteroidia bacterium]|nr:6-bladed beta-propeller [Bacteroidia bacterium]
MKRVYLFSALLFLSLHAFEPAHAQVYGPRNKKAPISIDVFAGLKNQIKMKLSDFADSIAYIPLQGLPEVPIGWVANLEMTPDELFVLASHEIGLLRFNYSGKLKNRIGRIGNGPGELSMGSDFSLSPEEKRIYFHRNFTHNELCFSYD